MTARVTSLSVEQILPNGDIVTSNSARRSRFLTCYLLRSCTLQLFGAYKFSGLVSLQRRFRSALFSRPQAARHSCNGVQSWRYKWSSRARRTKRAPRERAGRRANPVRRGSRALPTARRTRFTLSTTAAARPFTAGSTLRTFSPSPRNPSTRSPSRSSAATGATATCVKSGSSKRGIIIPKCRRESTS